MSSRALRRLQRQQEEQQQLRDGDDESSADDALDTKASPPKFNAFDLLGAQEEEEEEEHGSGGSGAEEVKAVEAPRSTPPPSKKKKQKKKKKSKKSTPTSEPKQPDATVTDGSEPDEIDKALQDLSIQRARRGELDESSSARPSDETDERLCALLAIEPRKLSSINEMKRLFGNVVLEGRQEDTQTPSRQRDRNRQAMDLERALAGEYSPASRGQSLAGAVLRKNALMQGKDEWPRAPSGGLGMEVVNKYPSDVTEYKLVHNTAYKDVQFQFEICVESMEPERMIQLLQFNRESYFIRSDYFCMLSTDIKVAYHISTLLQVSEIAKHQGDASLSADLIERALFNIGRSTHSSFGNRLKEGKVRMDFNIKENREFWLVGWRYIKNLAQKGTWKTAYEWAKLLLSLDPDDPYCINLLIDHLAIRGREYQHFASLCEHPTLSTRWRPFPNIQCSLALAYFHQGKPKESRERLRFAMTKFPWIFCRLIQELKIEPVPQSIWGVLPPSRPDDLFCEIYIDRSKDMWNTPEIISLLVEIADSIDSPKDVMPPPEITLNIARHVVLSDIREATVYLPQPFLSLPLSASDPLPPGQLPPGPQDTPAPSLVDAARRLFGIPPPEEGEGELGDDVHPHQEETDTRADMDREEAVQYLMHEGINGLREFIQVNGVDPGNWEDDIDMTALIQWVKHLRTLPPDTWFGYIESAADELESPMAVDLLLGELGEQGEEWAADAFS